MGQKILYLECNSGISGDMTVGALLDLGADRAFLEKNLDALNLGGYRIEVVRTEKCGLDACKFDVILTEEHEEHCHHAHHGHEHRTCRDILRMLREAALDGEVRALAEKIFCVLAKAEGAVHGTAPEDVHFHEVGAVDSIVDIVGTAACLVSLGVREAAVSTLAEGCGTVRCQHGEMPVPVPAVTELAAQYGLPVRITGTKGEMITPTGAAIAAAVRTRESLPERFQILGCGYGAGSKDFAHANVLRAMLVEEEEHTEEELWMLETNVDDCCGEQLGLLQERLFSLGARDVWFSPVYMKKCRPAYELRVLCASDALDAAQELLFAETTTIGVRFYPVKRRVLERRIERICTPDGEIRFKICTRPGGTEEAYPEYEDIRKICLSTEKSYREVRAAALAAAKRQTGEECADE